jgi:alginate O-acetyltransferase complex protein AlgI
MLFTEFRFLFFFLLVFSLYWFFRSNLIRKAFLLVCSYVFYGAWDWRFLSLILLSTAIDYIAGNQIQSSESEATRKKWLAVSLVANLGFLGFFKYFNFFIDSALGLTQFLGIPANASSLQIILPVGISFYTFQTLSYSIDIYRRKLQPVHNPLDFALYVSFFPQLVAGPIVRASDFLPQLNSLRQLADVRFRANLSLFLIGFIKKACISDNIAPLVDQYFSAPEAYDSFSAWMGVLLYTVQIYCDFSGYSDMAIACAGLLGYQFCLNFDFPYFARNMSDFWRRWHISLSTWLKDYLYIPLGGNRGGKWMTYRNLMVTMTLGGLWHGAGWTFIIWGIMHGFALIVQREWTLFADAIPRLQRFRLVAAPVITFYFVCLTWVFFRAPDFQSAATVLRAFALFDSPGSQHLPSSILLFLTALACIHWLNYRQFFGKLFKLVPDSVFAVMYGFATAFVLAFVPTSYTPFIYFQF